MLTYVLIPMQQDCWRLTITENGVVKDIYEGAQRDVFNELLRLSAPTLTTRLKARK